MSDEQDRRSAESSRIAAEGIRVTSEGQRESEADDRAAGEASRATHRRRVGAAQLVAYLLIIGVAALGFWQSAEDQKQIDRAQACTEVFLTETLGISAQRSEYARQVQEADREQNEAWADYVELVLPDATNRGKPPPEKERVRAVDRYFNALNDYLRVVRRAEANRIETPFPLVSDYRRCVRGSP